MAMVFYDTETTGTKVYFDQILQFAAILTDNDLNEIERFEIRSRLLPNVVAGPGAMRLTGVSVDQLHDPALPSHYEMVCRIRRKLLEWQASLYIGHNSLRFDEVLLRSAFYKNLLPPYLTNSAGNGRIDTLSMLQWAHKYEPDVIEIPTRPDGRPIFKLDQLAPANGYNQAHAHDAMSDVEATIHMARLMRNNAPDTWSRAMRFSNKSNVLDFCEGEMVFGLTEYYFRDYYSFLLHQVGHNPHDRNEIVAFDLYHDPADFVGLSSEALSRHLNASPKLLRRVRANALPGLIDADDAHPHTRVSNLPLEMLEERAEVLEDNETLREQLLLAYMQAKPEYEDSVHVEENIYWGFASTQDNERMDAFHEGEWSERAAIVCEFDDPRFRDLGEQLIYFEAPEVLTTERRQCWEERTARRLLGTGEPCDALTLPQALQEVNDLLAVAAGEIRNLLVGHRDRLEADLARLQSQYV